MQQLHLICFSLLSIAKEAPEGGQGQVWLRGGHWQWEDRVQVQEDDQEEELREGWEAQNGQSQKARGPGWDT